MEKSAVKKLFVVLLCVITVIFGTVTASAETIQDRIQKYINNRQPDTTVSDSGELTTVQKDKTTLDDIRDLFSGLTSRGGNDSNFSEEVQKLWDSLSDTDIGSVISEFDLQALYDMGSEAWRSGIDMIRDAIGGGQGTSDAGNTGTTVPMTTRAVATTYVISYDTTPTVTTPNNIVTTPVAEPTAQTTVQTNEVITVPAATIVPEEPVTSSVEDENTLSLASKIVIIIMSVATLGVIIAVVVFAVLKKR